MLYEHRQLLNAVLAVSPQAEERYHADAQFRRKVDYFVEVQLPAQIGALHAESSVSEQFEGLVWE